MSAMAGHTILLNLFGGVALLLWGTHMVRSAILRGFGAELRAAIGRAAGGPLRAATTGVAAATALQSATATAMLLTGFVGRGLIALPAALALMLGADLGTTLAVQALSLDLSAVTPLLLVAGVAVHRLAESARAGQVGRMLIGFGLILLALALIVAASAPLRASEVTALVLERLARDPILALVLGALLTWLMHSSVAFVLFVIPLAASGLIGLPLALTLVLGANVGCRADRARPGARRAGGGAARALRQSRLPDARGGRGHAGARPGDRGGRAARRRPGPAGGAFPHPLQPRPRAHLPAADRPSRRGCWRALFPEPDPGRERRSSMHLDPALFDTPALALNAATRAMMLLADKVELMLREAIQTFEDHDARRIRALEALEDEVDALQEEIKLYLARLMQRELTPQESAQVLEVVLLTTNLEHIGDIIDKGLLRLAAKKQKPGLRFSEAGWADIRAFHALIAEQMRRALTVFVSRDAAHGARPRRPKGPVARRGAEGDRAAFRAPARRHAGDDRDQPRCTSTCCATSSASTRT